MTSISKLLRQIIYIGLLASSLISNDVHAAALEMPDEDLSEVTASDGISFAIHLEWNPNALTLIDLRQTSSISLTYYDHTSNISTALVFQGFGGVADLWGLQIDARKGSGSMGDYIDITLPTFVAFNKFGFRALYAQSYVGQVQPANQPEPTSSYGSWLYNGAATVTGHVMIWPAK